MNALRTRVVVEDPEWPYGTWIEVEVAGVGWLRVTNEQKDPLLARGLVHLDAADELVDEIITTDGTGRPLRLRGFVESWGLAERYERFAGGQTDGDLARNRPPVDLLPDPDSGLA